MSKTRSHSPTPDACGLSDVVLCVGDREFFADLAREELEGTRDFVAAMAILEEDDTVGVMLDCALDDIDEELDAMYDE